MLASRLGHRVSRIVATVLLAGMYACTSDSQQAEEIVDTQQEDSAKPANLDGDVGSSEVSASASSEESSSSLSAKGETSTQSGAEGNGNAPKSDDNTGKVDSDGFVVDSTSNKESMPVVDDEMNPEEAAEKSLSAAIGALSSTDSQTATDSSSTTETSGQGTEPSSTDIQSGSTDFSGANQGESNHSSSIPELGLKNESKSDVSKNGKSETGVEFAFTVKKGDTLSHIAKEVYGRVGRWKKIAEHNKLANPELIFPGQKLMIPKFSDKSDRTALTTPTKTDQSLKNKSVKTSASGKLGASKKVGKAQTDKANSQKSEKSASKTDDASVPAKLNAAGVIWERPGDYSQVRPDGLATITWKPGFSIKKIAEVMFGDEQQWKKVLEFNNLDASDENRVLVGQRINFKVPVDSSKDPFSH